MILLQFNGGDKNTIANGIAVVWRNSAKDDHIEAWDAANHRLSKDIASASVRKHAIGFWSLCMALNDLAVAVSRDFEQRLYKEISHLLVLTQGAHRVPRKLVTS